MSVPTAPDAAAFWEQYKHLLRNTPWRVRWVRGQVLVLNVDGDDRNPPRSNPPVWQARSTTTGPGITPNDRKALRLAQILNDPLALECIKARGRLKNYPGLKVELL